MMSAVNYLQYLHLLGKTNKINKTITLGTLAHFRHFKLFCKTNKLSITKAVVFMQTCTKGIEQ